MATINLDFKDYLDDSEVLVLKEALEHYNNKIIGMRSKNLAKKQRKKKIIAKELLEKINFVNNTGLISIHFLEEPFLINQF